jgi:hypothetical protein
MLAAGIGKGARDSCCMKYARGAADGGFYDFTTFSFLLLE